MEDVCAVKGSKGHLAIEKDGIQTVLDLRVKTYEGQLFCVKIKINE